MPFLDKDVLGGGSCKASKAVAAFPLGVAVFMARGHFSKGAPQRGLCPLFAVCCSICAPDTVPVLAGLCVSAWHVVSMG